MGAEIDLNRLAASMEGGQYDPESFPGLVFRSKYPKTAALIFRSGKIVCTGSKTMEQLAEAIVRVAGIVKKAGFDVSDNPEYEVQNIVASADLGQPVNLTSVVFSLGLDKVEYEPEVFPGLVYRLSDPKVVILLFGSGRLVCTGGRTFNDVGAAVDKVAKELCSIC